MSGRRARMRSKDVRRVVAVFLVLLIVFVGVVVFLVFQGPSGNLEDGLRAVIVDQLSLTFPNQTFVKTATNMLNQSGYSVDYCAGENVTVDFYNKLMDAGYKIIILRVHSGIASAYNELAFFTSENFSQAHAVDVLYDRIGEVTYHDPPLANETAYFAIRYQFVKDYGRFNGTTVIVMGCYGMKYTSMAQAFIDRGAKIYIGWDGLESADHADEATTVLLNHLLVENQTVGQAVQNTVDEVKLDPVYNSSLAFYPLNSSNQRVQALATGLVSPTVNANGDENPVEFVVPVSSPCACVRATVQEKEY